MTPDRPAGFEEFTDEELEDLISSKAFQRIVKRIEYEHRRSKFYS